jgi:nucleoside 2-deoxyribosyltransferase
MSRAERLLRWNVDALEWQPNSADYTVMPAICQLGASYSVSVEEVQRLNRLLAESGYYEHVRGQHIQSWLVTARGRLRIEELQRSRAASSTAFVAMWFSEETKDAWESGIKPGVQTAGYDPVRVDQIEHAGRIDDQIILQINRSRFIVADFTGHRGGVYFEAGYALGKGLDVIWTCRADQVNELHFDIRQYNCIVWQEPADLLSRLPNRIENTAGLGPRAPSTTA